MARRRKRTELEEAIWQAAQKLFLIIDPETRLPQPPDEHFQMELANRAEWDRILAMAYDESGWLVSPDCAAGVATWRWWNAIFLGEYERASAEIARCLNETGPFERLTTADLPILLSVPMLLGAGDSNAAKALEHHIECGTYLPAKIAWWIAIRLHRLPDERDPSSPVSDEVRSLAKALAVARKNPKYILRACDEIQSWDDFFAICDWVAGG